MRKYLIILSLLAGSIHAIAQNEVDALRYSFNTYQGTARSMAMGGAFGALGADLSVLSINPAGIAFFRRNEFAFTPSIQSIDANSSYNGISNSQNKSILQVSNIGIIGSYGSTNPQWSRFNFGIGYNKLSSFQETILIEGPASNTTLLDVLTNQAQGNLEEDLWDLFPFGAALAYETFLINPTDTGGVTTYTNLIRDGGDLESLYQINKLERTGSTGETVLSGGTNYMEKLYIGLSLGFPNIRFRELSTYTENRFSNSTEVGSWNYTSDLLTTGNGFNFKIGAIYRVNKSLRLGAAYHSPSWINLRDSYETNVSVRFIDGGALEALSPLGNYEYNLKTPSRYLASAAFILGKSGVISADYEFVDYSQNQLRASTTISDSYDFSAENATIQDIYRSVHSVRVGLEGRLADSFRVRAGMAYQQSPFVNGVTVSDGDVMSYSGGLGYRNDRFYIDLAYVLSMRDSDHYFYDPSAVEAATIDRNQQIFALTLGFRY